VKEQKNILELLAREDFLHVLVVHKPVVSIA
jgi:hypothetical protein